MQRAQHLFGVEIAHRMETEYDVLEQLDQRAAQTAYQERAEGWIAGDAGHHLDAAANLPLQQNVFERRSDSCGSRLQRAHGLRHRGRRVEVEDHAPGVALVNESWDDRFG